MGRSEDSTVDRARLDVVLGSVPPRYLTVAEAARMTSTSAAKLVGEGRRKGRLAPGYDADVTVLTPGLSVETVWRSGKHVYTLEGR